MPPVFEPDQELQHPDFILMHESMFLSQTWCSTKLPQADLIAHLIIRSGREPLCHKAVLRWFPTIVERFSIVNPGRRPHGARVGLFSCK